MLYRLQKLNADGDTETIREFAHETELIEAQSECDNNLTLQIVVIQGVGIFDGSVIYPVDDDFFEEDESDNQAELCASGCTWICSECGAMSRKKRQ